MLFKDAYRYLLSLGHETLTIKLGLKNTEKLLAALGNPEHQYPAVQIAGTNGKGSTAVFLDSICRAAGIRTGLFTSPHLISITERIKVADEAISETQFARLTGIVKSVADQLVARGELQTLPTYFEHVTAIALLAFARAHVDLAILETGLGGRLDATTAARARVVAITSIAMDHEEYLGDTIEKIAAEKAAIITKGVAAIVAPQEPNALAVIVRRCESVGVKPRFVDPNSVKDATLGLRGRHQAVNAATAVALAEALRDKGFSISPAAIAGGLSNARHLGRLELWNTLPPVLFDGAHNPAAAQALRNYLHEFVHQPITMIFAAMRDKQLTEMAATLFPAVREVILTQLDNPRAATIDELRKAAPDEFNHANLHGAHSIAEAWQIAREITNPDQLILVTGSLYLVGTAQASEFAPKPPAH